MVAHRGVVHASLELARSTRYEDQWYVVRSCSIWQHLLESVRFERTGNTAQVFLLRCLKPLSQDSKKQKTNGVGRIRTYGSILFSESDHGFDTVALNLSATSPMKSGRDGIPPSRSCRLTPTGPASNRVGGPSSYLPSREKAAVSPINPQFYRGDTSSVNCLNSQVDRLVVRSNEIPIQAY